MKGRLITVEGIDGAGKTEQLIRLASALRSLNIAPVTVTKEPGGTDLGGTDLGAEIRRLLLDGESPIAPETELLLFAADRAQHVQKLIRPLLNQGHIILCDRYTDSTLAYQGYGRGLDLRLIHQLNAIATMGTIPDLTIWLDVEPEIAQRRLQGRQQANRLDQLGHRHLQKVRDGFQAIYEANQRVVCIDANSDIDSVAARVLSVVSQKLGEWKDA